MQTSSINLQALRFVVVSALALATVLMLGVTGCATVVNSRVEQVILRELPARVGPALSYCVKAVGAAPSAGLLDSVQVEGKRIARLGAPVIDHADVTLRGVRFDREQKRVESIRDVDANVKILAPDISEYLNTRTSISAASTQFAGSNEVTVSAVMSIAGVALPGNSRIELRGFFVPDGPRLQLNVTSL